MKACRLVSLSERILENFQIGIEKLLIQSIASLTHDKLWMIFKVSLLDVNLNTVVKSVERYLKQQLVIFNK